MPDPAKVLVVDDEPSLKSIILQLFKNPIKKGDIQFSFALNGKEAMEILKRDQEIGIILTDINMPGLDGLSFLNQLYQLKRLYRAIVISAYGDLGNIRTAMNRGACDFIPKPIDLKDLESTLNKVIEQYNYMKEMDRAQNQVIEFRKELEIASEIQRSLIPQSFEPMPNQKNVRLYGKMIPAKEVGGDLFDFFPLDDQRLAFVIADVSGKGVPAALFMTMTRALISGFALECRTTKDCLSLVNQALANKNDTSMFVTAFYGIVNTATGEVSFCNAGHNPPYLLSVDGQFSEIGKNEGVPLGVVVEAEEIKKIYCEKHLQLKSGDCLLLYTDGATDARNPSDELLGEMRFRGFVRAQAGKPVRVMIENLVQDLTQYIGTADQADDITLLGIEFVRS